MLSCRYPSRKESFLLGLNTRMARTASVKLYKGCCPFFDSPLREKHFNQHAFPLPPFSSVRSSGRFGSCEFKMP